MEKYGISFASMYCMPMCSQKMCLSILEPIGNFDFDVRIWFFFFRSHFLFVPIRCYSLVKWWIHWNCFCVQALHDDSMPVWNLSFRCKREENGNLSKEKETKIAKKEEKRAKRSIKREKSEKERENLRREKKGAKEKEKHCSEIEIECVSCVSSEITHVCLNCDHCQRRPLYTLQYRYPSHCISVMKFVSLKNEIRKNLCTWRHPLTFWSICNQIPF